MSKKVSQRRKAGNRVGKLMNSHSEACMELARANEKLKAGDENMQDRIGALEKCIADILEEIYLEQKKAGE